MSDRPPVTPLPTASVQDVLNALANASPSLMQLGINMLNDMIRNMPADLSSGNSADVAKSLEVHDFALELLWDELTVEPLVNFGKNFV